jgi:hypothetical protein
VWCIACYSVWVKHNDQQHQLSYRTTRWTKYYKSHLCRRTWLNLIPHIHPVLEALISAQRPTTLTDLSTCVFAVVWMTNRFFWEETAWSCLCGSWYFETLWWSYIHGSGDTKVVLTLEDETITVSQNVGNHMPSDAVSIPRADSSSWLLIFVVFIIYTRQIWGRYFKSDDSYLLHHIFQFAKYLSSYYSML